MDSQINTLLRLRLLVGYLGEKNQHNWWPCSFFSPASESFLKPVYPRTTDLARYNGVQEAARLLHDERIGVGQVFHLFRLPENTEFRLHEAASDQESLQSLLEDLVSTDQALRALADLCDNVPDTRAGPVRVGDRKALERHTWAEDAAAHYLAGFRGNEQCFPFITANE